MRKLILIVLLFDLSFGYSQENYTVSGNVIDTENRLVSVGDVLLFPEKDSMLLKYTSVLDGKFFIEGIPNGAYRLQISCLGFQVSEQVLTLDKNTSLEIQLKERATNLDEVELVAAKPMVTNNNGNLKVDVTNPLFTSIPNPMELLSRLPSLQVSADRASLSVIGKGSPLIYLGNQRISLEEFNALSVDEISTIEIIRNPSAKYEAFGRAVLLITQKGNIHHGYKLNLSETLSFKQNFNNYNSLNGNYKKKKLILKANFAYNDLQLWESHQFEFGILKADVLSDYLVLSDEGNRIQINMGGGLLYQINKTDYFSANATVRLQSDDYFINTDTFLKQGTNEDDIITKTDNENTKDFVSGNFNYNKKWNSKTNLFAGLQYSSFIQRLNTDISNNFNTTRFIHSQDRQQKYRIDVLAYRLDVEKTFKNDMKLEVGTNISTANANSLTNIQFLETNANTNIDYDYTESTFAGYSQLSGGISEKVNFNVGFRLENNVVQGGVEAEAIPLIDRANTNLFPKAMLNFEIDSSKSLTFNYAKSISRPNYSNASSISAFINPFLEGAGNVNLLPTLTEELSANFQFQNNSLTLEYSKRRNPSYYTIGYSPEVNRAIFSLKNLEEEFEYYLNLNIPITKGIWTSTNSLSVSMRKIKDATAIIRQAQPYIYAYTDHQFKLRKNAIISFGGWALTKRSEGIFERNAMLVLNAGISKTFLEKLQCSLRFNDITRAMNFEEQYAINGVNADGTYFADGQEIAFSMKYTFGKIKDLNYKIKNVDENLNRIR